MSLWRQVKHGLRGLLRRDEKLRDAEDEVQQFVALAMADYVAQGMTPAEARRAAGVDAGNVTSAVQELRGYGWEAIVESIVFDLKFALRSLLRTRGFAIVAILTVALGIGANTAMFSVVNGVLLRPLDYREPERLVFLASKFPGLGFDKFWISPPEYFELAERTRSYSAIAAFTGSPSTTSIAIGDASMRAQSRGVTPNLFATLGVMPALGSAFDSSHGLPNGEPVAIISHELWQQMLGGDSDAIGRQMMVNGVSTRLIGVMPPGLRLNDAVVDVWGPLVLDPSNRQNRGSHFLHVVGRLAPGASMAGAESELRDLVAGWATLNPDTHVPTPQGHPLFLTGLQDTIVGPVRPALLLLLGLVGFVLLISCANVANLLLVRAQAREKEIAVRSAMGAARIRLLRQFLTEGLALSLVGGVLGVVIGYAGLKGLLLLAPEGIPRLADIRLDGRVLLFSLAVSLLTGLVFGLAPLLHTGMRRMGLALREGGQRTTAGAAQRRIQRALVVSELALAVTLVVGAGLMLRSFDALRRTDPGFNPENLLTMQVFLPAAQYAGGPELTAATSRLIEAMRAVPGVTSVAAVTGLPPLRNVNANDTEFEGLKPPPDGPPQNVDYYQFVSSDYLQTMGVELAAGRGFESIDHVDGARVVLINERLAEVFYPNVNPIGQRLRPPGPPDAPWWTIVGVVKNVKQGGIDAEVGTELYVHLPQFPARTLNFVVRSPTEPASLLPALTTAVRSVDATLPIGMPRTMEDVVGQSLARPRFLTILLACFAAIALGLAAVGTYGVMAFTVAQRTQEVGVRMALGGLPSSVVRLVFRQSFGVALVGIVVGVAGALALTRLMQGLLYGISATDVWSYAIAVAVLGAVAAAACLIPSVRAARVDPARALRE